MIQSIDDEKVNPSCKMKITPPENGKQPPDETTTTTTTKK